MQPVYGHHKVRQPNIIIDPLTLLVGLFKDAGTPANECSLEKGHGIGFVAVW